MDCNINLETSLLTVYLTRLSHHPPDRSHPWAHPSPLVESPVLARAHEVLAAPVVRVFIEDPVSLLDVTGVDIVKVKAVVKRGTVIRQLHHLTSELRTLVNHHPVRALLL